jgi:hypothetical protein
MSTPDVSVALASRPHGDVDLDPDVIYAALNLGPDKARIYVLAPSVAA